MRSLHPVKSVAAAAASSHRALSKTKHPTSNPKLKKWVSGLAKKLVSAQKNLPGCNMVTPWPLFWHDEGKNLDIWRCTLLLSGTKKATTSHCFKFSLKCDICTAISIQQGSWSQCCLGSLYWAWAGWAERQICMLLVQKWILRQIFKKAKQQICTSNSQICFPAQTARAHCGLPGRRWLWELWLLVL